MIDRRWTRAVALAFALCAGTAWAAHGATELEVSARLQPDIIGIDELVHFRIEVRGAGFGGRSFDPRFEIENLEVVNGPSSDSRFQYVNGAASRSLTLSWVLRPLAVGQARVHGIEVQVEDDVFALPDETLTIQEESVGRPEPEGRGQTDPFERFFPSFSPRGRRAPTTPRRIFLRAEVEPADPYVGQQALYILYLFTQLNVNSITPEVLPDFAGLWVRELPQPAENELEIVDIDGQKFHRVPILRRAIFPIRPGEIELGPAKVHLTVRVPDRTFGSMFSQTEQVRRDSNPLRLTARALPDPAPEGFDGAVGTLRVAAELTPSTLTLGDAATYSVTLSGAGHLQGLPTPTLSGITGLRSFPPQQESDERFVGQQVRGRRTWSWVLVPEATGAYELPAIAIPYFDPRTGQYEEASAASARLVVSAAVTTAAVPDAPPAALEGKEAALATGAPALSAVAWPRVLPWVLVALLLGTLAFVLRSRYAAGSNHPTHALSAALKLAAGKEKPREAAALIEDGWRSFLETRWNIPPGTPSTQWGRRLEEIGAPAESASSLVALADDLHYLRYAPQLSDTEALKQELILRSTKLGRALK